MWPNVTGSKEPGQTAPLMTRAGDDAERSDEEERRPWSMTVHADSEPFGQLQPGVAVNPLLPGFPTGRPAQRWPAGGTLHHDHASLTHPAVTDQRTQQGLHLARLDVVGRV